MDITDQQLNDVVFCETLLGAILEIESMSQEEQHEYLKYINCRELTEGRTVERTLIKLALIDPVAREEVKQQLKSGKVYSHA